MGLESFRNQINSQIIEQSTDQINTPRDILLVKPKPKNAKQIVEDSRLETLAKIQINVAINNASLVILLTIITWVSLYFLLEPLAKANKAREEFLIQASHELRTPLAILYSELSLSKDEVDVSELQKIHSEALGEIQRLRNLSDTLLGRTSHKLMKIEVKELILEIWNNLIIHNSGKMLLNVSDEKDLIVEKDYTKFYQLIFNILENVVKHGKPKTILKITLNSNSIIFENESENETFVEGLGITISNNLAESLGIQLESVHEKFKHSTVLKI